MATYEEVNENSTWYLTATPKDKDGNPQVPTTMEYRVDCLTTGTMLRTWTALTPGSSVEITLVPADSVICTATNDYEIHVVTVRSTFGVGQEHYAEYEYRVLNLHAAPKTT